MSTDPSEIAAAGVKAGDVLAGKYRVDRVLGVGGMGVVVAAHHLHLDEHVAIKFLLPQALESPDAVARFDREARAAVKIKSEHVARVIDVGKLENGAPYMVMEYLEGQDLSAWLTERGRLPIEQAVQFVLQACEAIAEAHAAGVVHRDLKPANLFCIRRPDGALSIKVLDFGISKATGPGGSMGMTKTHTVMGSPLYMSPEQMASSKGVDARADIWALGVILYELVTGRVPFEGEAITELVLQIVTGAPPPLSGLLPGVPPGLEHIIHRCLEKDRDRRYASVSELANDLIVFGPPASKLSVERIAGIMNAAGMPARTEGSLAATGPRPAQHIGAPTARMTNSAWGQTGGETVPHSGPKLALVFGGVAAFVLVAVAGVLLVTRKAPPVASAVVSPAAPPPVSSIPVGLAPAPTEAPSSTIAPPASDAPLAATTPQTPTPATPTRQPSRPAASGAATTAAATKPGGKASCDPPYFIDSSGHRQYKPECL